MSDPLTLDAFLARWAEAQPVRLATARAVLAIAGAAGDISVTVRRGPLAGQLGASTGGNAQGDDQKELDVQANDLLIVALKAAGVGAIASEELDNPEPGNVAGAVAVALDPLDGSSNIDTNVSIGTIFSVLPMLTGGIPADVEGGLEKVFLQPGSQQLAAGYVIYGPHVAMVLSVGTGTHFFTLDPDGQGFIATAAPAAIPRSTAEFAINSSNYRHWSEAIRSYVDHCVSGREGPHGTDFNMRWIASLVAECHRILVRGGVFLYPRDNRKGYENGRLRLVYEANPIAFLVEGAGGKATDGWRRILDIIPDALHQRTALIFGSAGEVERIASYKTNPGASFGDSQLFGRRGLLKA